MSALLEAARSVWPFDSEPFEMGVEDGIVWAITPGPIGGFNGYVLIPAEGHPWSAGIPSVDRDWEELESERALEVHGGITYGASGPWIGFDTMHAFDTWDREHDPMGLTTRHGRHKLGKHWTPELVAEEAKRLARQLAAIEQ